MEAPRTHPMKKQMSISRKIFIRMTTGASLGFVLWLWYRLTNFQAELGKRVEFAHRQDIPLGINYFGGYYLYRTENSLRAFSTTCTHAGCRIGKGSGDTLQCSCHGSQFEGQTGRPFKGPAIKPLRELECSFNTRSGQWIVKFRSGGDRNV